MFSITWSLYNNMVGRILKVLCSLILMRQRLYWFRYVVHVIIAHAKCFQLNEGLLLFYISITKYRLQLGLLWPSLPMNSNIEIFTGGWLYNDVIYAFIVFVRLLIYEYPIG
jgi:hypothetical protein